MQAATLVRVATGVRLNVSQTGTGEPLLLIMGTSGSLGLWEPLVAPFAARHRVIAFDNRGLGQSERGAERITMASLAVDAVALLDALEIERAHVLGRSAARSRRSSRSPIPTASADSCCTRPGDGWTATCGRC
jgi:pimeloyl-ACP methyl ester carboxylesterase